MNKAEAIKALQEYKERGCHMLIPTTQCLDSLSDQFEVFIDTVTLKNHPKDKDVYPHEKSAYNYKTKEWNDPSADNEVRIHKQGLNKLNINSGLIWSPTLCRLITDPINKGRRAYEAVGGVRKPDGQPYFIPKLYAMDLDIEEEKLRNQYKVGKDATDYRVTRDLLQKKSNIDELCESGAKNRVTREILCLEEPYTTESLKKEFVMVRIVPKLDLKDEYTRKRLIDIQLAALSGIYGLQIPSAEPDRKMIEHAAPIDIELIKESAQSDDSEDLEPDNGKQTYKLEPQDMGKKEIDPVDVFARCSADLQTQQIDEMAKVKGYNLTGWLTKVKKLSVATVNADRRVQLYAYLLSMPGKDGKPGVEADDDVPFD